MLFQILKKDLRKRKGINFILFLFITLATLFLASSVNNIIVVSNSIEYYLDYANMPDAMVLVNTQQEKEQIDMFLKDMEREHIIEQSVYDYLYTISEKSLQIKKDEQVINLDSDGASLYLGALRSDYAKVYDESGDAFVLSDGEVALSVSMMDKNGLSVGDHLLMKINGKQEEFLIKEKMKDAVFGNDSAGMNRIIVSQHDHERLQDSFDHFGLYYVTTEQLPAFTEKLNAQNFITIMNTVTRDMYFLIYSFDLILAGLLIVIGICLILIALLVLRFTLVFTMEEQYQEIGILKAIGLRNYAIKKIYLMKYLAIVMTGAALGTLVSIPVSTFMIQSVSLNMILEDSSANIAVNILCAVLIVGLVLSFCYFCTRKLNKVSAIHAIRGGDSGERFQKLKGFRLSKRKHMPVCTYLGINDIASNVRQFIVLIITFCISFILITIPLNTLNTMKSTEMVRKFLLDPNAAVYVRAIELPNEAKYNRKDILNDGVDRVQRELSEKGYDAELSSLALFFMNFTATEGSAGPKLLTVQMDSNRDIDYLDYEEGSAPVLENEVAFSKSVLKMNGWEVGNTVYTQINGTPKKLLISGSYTDYMQLGNSARLNPIIDMDKENMFDYWVVSVYMDTQYDQEELAAVMKEQLPGYEWMSGQRLIDRNVGGIQDALEQQLIPMTALLCAIIMLITLLMERLFITRGKGEIAMMKSCGFTYRAIRNWQLMRMVCVVVVAMVISIPLSLLSNEFILRPIFAIMGADIVIQIDALQVYFIYPCVLLTGILLAAAAAARSIRKIDIHEMNNLE